MVQDENGLDQITGKVLKQTGYNEPTGQFTDRVMESILLAHIPVEKSTAKRQQYLWFLLLIPILAAAGWYLSTDAGALKKLIVYIEPLSIIFHSFIAAFTGLFSIVDSISLSPFVLKTGLAISFLLVIESFYTKRKSLH